jgi:hypothetical protein
MWGPRLGRATRAHVRVGFRMKKPVPRILLRSQAVMHPWLPWQVQ